MLRLLPRTSTRGNRCERQQTGGLGRVSSRNCSDRDQRILAERVDRVFGWSVQSCLVRLRDAYQSV